MNVDWAAANTYLKFVQARHDIWRKRQAGEPWDQMDPVLATRKFTNVYRLLDPGSQFVITDLLPGAETEDYLMRCFLYRYTNLPATWRFCYSMFGEYPRVKDLKGSGLATMIKDWRDEGHTVFSGAYVILPKPNHRGDKVEQAVQLAREFTDDHAPDFLAAETQQERYDVLRRPYGVGEFMAMQILTDWGYGTEFRENDFVVAGPGSIKGCAVVAPGQKPEDVIRWAQEAVWMFTDVELQHRAPSLMDIQNTFCEFSKYVKGPRANPYVPAHPGAQDPPVLPPRW